MAKGTLWCNADSLLHEDRLFDSRTRLSDIGTWREVGTFDKEPLGTTVPQDENVPTCAPSGLEPPTYHILGLQH